MVLEWVVGNRSKHARHGESRQALLVACFQIGGFDELGSWFDRDGFARRSWLRSTRGASLMRPQAVAEWLEADSIAG